MLVSRSLGALGTAVLAGVILAGCSTQANRAPVEDRGQSASSSSSVDVKSLPGAENAGKPGYYTIKPGDTLIKVGLEHGQSWKDIARWSNLDNPNVIEVGQVVRVVPPGRDAPVASSGSGRSVAPVVVGGGSTATSSSATTTPAATATPVPSTPATTPAPVAKGADDVNFIWPASGSLIAGFDEARNKGYDISGKAGDPVLAAADGRVVYAGAGLRGYGNLIILKHNNTYLTAYAHNQSLLVKEDQSVKKGQKIAEMGSTDADRVKLHFEVRRQGKPVDPSRYLPSR
ncbi:peptidoglycan DD-metalloendopeptidase family protein [Comamonas resistens]|uniref:Peptidoglycan DD-metalloendopeptidase family protein n=1 Tax=Comamonas resistens TaxID=3046670 RepID=A0ABY8SLT1_9BURK|nr:peptidoglycan DD-metalloendopeptidase family protein [Comamonas resistens]MDL5038549.1 peptidoglycan DD-metalloendopeptidase family protein [Comamonas resistens]WHS64037.1 peptidoglycan DD-metalloendopeptidase family protein [Comamonas resistens]